MRLHVVNLPHTQPTKEFSACAYTSKVRKFIPMMEAQGFEVILHQPLDVDRQARFGFHGPEDYLKIDFNANLAIWKLANATVLASILQQKEPGDIVCLITGTPHQWLVDALPDLRCVEFGVGYLGICQNTYRVFESNAWRNHVYGWWHMQPSFYDEVIPNYYELEDFPIVETPDDYYGFVGRMNADKGYSVAEQVCKKNDLQLVLAGQGTRPTYGDYRGLLPYEDVIKIMANAKAMFVPTTYLAPFEGVHVEAQLCGTPVIVSDQGVFTETVENHVNGFRCKMFRDFENGAIEAPTLDRLAIAEAARERYSLKTVGEQYSRYFERLATLDGPGWYA
jgi:glycosyltransferase involved in cell wall biosynthesis